MRINYTVELDIDVERDEIPEVTRRINNLIYEIDNYTKSIVTHSDILIEGENT